MAREKNRGDMLQGTLDMLILKAVLPAPAHGHTIAHVIEKTSEDVLQVEHGSLYPALHPVRPLLPRARPRAESEDRSRERRRSGDRYTWPIVAETFLRPACVHPL